MGRFLLFWIPISCLLIHVLTFLSLLHPFSPPRSVTARCRLRLVKTVFLYRHDILKLFSMQSGDSIFFVCTIFGFSSTHLLDAWGSICNPLLQFAVTSGETLRRRRRGVPRESWTIREETSRHRHVNSRFVHQGMFSFVCELFVEPFFFVNRLDNSLFPHLIFQQIEIFNVGTHYTYFLDVTCRWKLDHLKAEN